ncbi:DMT family transporter [bacterium]|nr:DMT family transporter [bacterium]
MKTKIYIAYALLSIIWGTTWYALKVSLNEGMVPSYAVGIRFLCSGLIFWGIMLFRREKLPLNKKAISIYLQFGFLNFGISYALTYWGTQYIYSNLASILWASFPIITSIIAHFYLSDEKLNSRKIASLTLGIIGTVLIISQSENLGGKNVGIGVIVILLAVLVASWPNVYLKKYKSVVNTFQLNAMAQSIGGIFLLSIAIFTEPGQAMIWTKINLLATVYLIIFGSVITFSLYYWLFSYLSLSQITYVTFFPPIIAIFIGWIFLNERLSFLILFGAILIIIGALLVNYKRK